MPPSGALCGGSEERQAAFVKEIFRWWDEHPTQLELVSFTWLTDIPEDAVEGYLEYTDDPIVSSDVIGDPHSSLVDGGCTMVGEGGKMVDWKRRQCIKEVADAMRPRPNGEAADESEDWVGGGHCLSLVSPDKRDR